MKKIYTWCGCGYRLNECVLNDDAQYFLEIDDLESVICHLIDTDQIEYIEIDENFIFEYDENELDASGWLYIDNTFSDIKEKQKCYYVLIENMRVI